MKTRANRKHAGVDIGYRRHGLPRVRARLLDISRTGCLIEVATTLDLQEQIWIYLGNLQPLQSEVVRMNKLEAGCSFHQPINRAVFEHWVARLGS